MPVSGLTTASAHGAEQGSIQREAGEPPIDLDGAAPDPQDAASPLQGRADSATSCGPRLDPLAALCRLIEAVRRCFSPAQPPEAGRRPGARGVALPIDPHAAIEALTAALTATDAQPETIRPALWDAVQAARQLAQADATNALPQALADHLENMDRNALCRLAAALRGQAAVRLQASLRCQPADPDAALEDEADQWLRRLGMQVQAELGQRASAAVEASVDAAFDCARSPHEAVRARAADQLHFAFEAAIPFLEPMGLAAGDERQKSVVSEQVRAALAIRTGADLPALLTQIRTEDLERLLDPARDDSALAQALCAERDGRPQRLSGTFRQQAAEFIARYSAGTAGIDPGPFVRDLSRLTATLIELRQRSEGDPLLGLEYAAIHERLLPPLRVIVGQALAPGGIDRHRLDAEQVLALTAALKALGLKSTRGLLGKEQQACLEARHASHRRGLSAFLGELASGRDPQALLRALAGLERASGALRSAMSGLHELSSDEASWDASQHADQVEDILILESLERLPGGERAALAATAVHAQSQALISALEAGALLASRARETSLAARFADMARLLRQIARHLGVATPRAPTLAAGTGEPSAVRSSDGVHTREPPPWTHLAEETRRALGELYGLCLPPGGPAVLQVGRLAPPQFHEMARTLEKPASESESKLTQAGPYRIGQKFYDDAMRWLAYRLHAPANSSAPVAGGPSSPRNIVPNALPRPLAHGDSADDSPAGTPLIDTRDWPGGELALEELLSLGEQQVQQIQQQREERVAAGFERLIALCDGDERLARALTVHAHQGLMAAFFTPCASAEGPLRLPDGRAGLPQPKKVHAATDERTEIGFSLGANGLPLIDVGYQLRGGAVFVTAADGKPIYLSPQSHLRVHFRAELQEDGGLLLLEPPSYGFDLQPDEFQKPYPPPTVAALLQEPEGGDLLLDVVNYGRAIGAEHLVLALRALDAFEREPTSARARGVLSALDGKVSADGSDGLSLPPGTREVIRQGSPSSGDDGLRPTPGLFAGLREALVERIEAQVLPGMIEAVKSGAA